MALELPCGCGHVVTADAEASLVAKAQQHARQAHGMSLTPEHVLMAAFRAELETEAWSDPNPEEHT
jgi:predicted small metal-binding protein